MITVTAIDENTKQVKLSDGTVSVTLSADVGNPLFSWDNALSAVSPLDNDGSAWSWDVPSQSYLQQL